MNVQDALAYIGGRLLAYNTTFDIDALIAYADEDHEGGRRAGFDDWSIDPDEGKLLYALVRALRPAKLLEIGVREGASTAHLLAAIEANGEGFLTSIDSDENSHANITVTNTDRRAWEFLIADAATAVLPAADLIFEDSQHGLHYSLELFEKLRALSPRILITHDYNMTEAHGDFYVREAFDAVFPDGFPITLDGCERGLAVWINPAWKPVVVEIADAATSPQRATRTTKPRAKRTPKK